MDEVEINVTENVDEVVINVYEGTVQTDWDETNTAAASYLKNKPTIDDTVTETSQNAVKSSGIWTWVTGLFTAFSATLKTIATSGVHNDATGRDEADQHPKSAITGLEDSATPTFADTTIPALASEASYDDATLAYLNSLFESLSDSVKENFIRTWQRMAVVENNLIYEDELIEKVTEINNSGFTIPRGKGVAVIINVPSYENADGDAVSGRVVVQINGVTSSNNYRTRSASLPYFSPQPTAYASTQGEIRLFNQGKVLGFSGFDSGLGGSHVNYSHETLFEVENITEISISNELSNCYFSAGTRVMIIRT